MKTGKVVPPNSASRSTAGGFLFLLLAVGGLAGCAINPAVNLAEHAEPGPAVELADVPFYPQKAHQCGPAALAGVLGASGVTIDPEALVPQVYLPEREGSLQFELMAATRRAGRIPFPVSEDIEALMMELDAGRPVLVLQNLGTRSFPYWHYAVVTGYDPADNEVILNSGKRQGKHQGARSFLRTWDWAGRWAIVALEPGETPAIAQGLHYLDAVAAFEQVAGPEAALPAWQAGIERWPDDYRSWLSLGNAYAALDELRFALETYARGLQVHPGQLVLENNLAHVLGELGCARMAHQRLSALRERNELNGRWASAVESTLEQMKQQSRPDEPGCQELLTEPATPIALRPRGDRSLEHANTEYKH